MLEKMDIIHLWKVASALHRPKGHASVSKGAKGIGERRHILVLRVHSNLVVSGVAIKEAVVALAN
jgi:hypothetical protein